MADDIVPTRGGMPHPNCDTVGPHTPHSTIPGLGPLSDAWCGGTTAEVARAALEEQLAPLNDVIACGPPPSRRNDPEDARITRVSPDDMTLEDRAAIMAFAGFLRGDLWVCPVCTTPDDTCKPGDRCCPDCPGVHVTAKGRVIARRTMDGAPT